MSEIEMKIEVDEPAIVKKFANAQTQHGREETAEEENIVVLAVTRSPVREESDEVVWHEDTEEVSFAFIFFLSSHREPRSGVNIRFPITFSSKASSEIKSHLITHNWNDLNELRITVPVHALHLKWLNLIESDGGWQISREDIYLPRWSDIVTRNFEWEAKWNTRKPLGLTWKHSQLRDWQLVGDGLLA